MKILFVVFIIFYLSSIAQAIDLTVMVTGFKNNKGAAQISLYNKYGTIPDKNQDKFYKTKRVFIINKKIKVVFKNLPKGRYAISVYHDENNNHKLDRGWFLPKEGVGLSNFHNFSLFNFPSFKKASFLLNDNKEIKIKIIYL